MHFLAAQRVVVFLRLRRGVLFVVVFFACGFFAVLAVLAFP